MWLLDSEIISITSLVVSIHYRSISDRLAMTFKIYVTQGQKTLYFVRNRTGQTILLIVSWFSAQHMKYI